MQAVSPEVATLFRAALANGDTGISEHAVLALSGPAGSSNGWYLGALTHENVHYFAIVVVEETDELGVAESVGRKVLTAVQNQ